VRLCDVRKAGAKFHTFREKVRAVITSPPYLNTTRVEEDQWLRLWFLGGPPHPTYYKVSADDRLEFKPRYWEFLKSAWQGIASLLKPSAVLVCRLGATSIDIEAVRDGLLASLRAVWSRVELLDEQVTRIRNRQTEMLLPSARGCRFEVDVAVRLRALRV
jgi:tRNA G10  N-methylase Trm11